jgi:aminoglycoside phosphotransferase (APT) family kinase protein
MNSLNGDIDQISEKLITYLRDELNNSTLDYVSPLAQLQGGYETNTYRFKLSGIREELSKPLVLRLYPQYYGTRNAIWESTIQNVLASEGYPVSKVHITCTDMSILGGAFFIMEFLSGEQLINSPPETVPDLLGKTHAALHRIDPKAVIKKLSEQGIEEYEYRLASRLDWLNDRAGNLPWISEGVNWLMENYPPEPEHLAVCHGDFHALNILIQDGKVTGVLDWPGFIIADPVLDVANTIVLNTIPSKHIAASIGSFSSVDWEMVVKLYLDAYQTQSPLNSEHLDYYRVMRCVNALIQGFEGQKIWQHPKIVKDLIEYIHKITDLVITMPG